MKKYLNTLFVTTPGAYLHKEGESVLVKVEDETRLRVPIHMISGVVCFGQVSCSPPAMGFCAENNVSISFLTEYGRFLARVEGPVSGNVLLRKEQYRRADNQDQSLAIAKAFLAGKIANSRTVLERALRDHAEKPGMSEVRQMSNRLSQYLKRIPNENSMDGLRGVEGEAAHSYFSVFNHLITPQKEDFVFDERNKRPPLDRVNALLSFVYTLLMHDVRSALETVGLDPAVGFLHRDRPGRPGLALDMMEEFRSFIADRTVLSLINLQKVRSPGFRKTDTGSVEMDDDTRKEVLVAYQERKQSEVRHPFLDETVAVGLLPYVQALLLARHLRGDLDAYPPFFWK